MYQKVLYGEMFMQRVISFVYKKCTKCGVIKDISEFYKSKSQKDGLDYNCKKCKKQYRENNKEAKAKYDKQYKKDNKEKVAIRAKLWHQKNKEKVSIRGRIWYQENKENVAKRAKLWRTNNKEKRIRYRLDNKETIIKSDKQYRKKNKEVIAKSGIRYRTSNAKYDLFYDKLTVDESPKLHKDGVSLEVKCKYCNKYFVPSYDSTKARVRALNETSKGANHLYCSEECKAACSIYHMKEWSRGFKHVTSREVLPDLRQIVLERDNWTCQICDKTIEEVQLHCHHMDPVVQNPMFQNDMDSCVTLCKDCHKMVHSRIGCRYIDLRC